MKRAPSADGDEPVKQEAKRATVEQVMIAGAEYQVNMRILVLIAKELTSLPSKIGRFSDLRELYLSYNQLDSLPPQIGNLSGLKELYISSNRFASLPPQICNLSGLEKLSLANNRFASLPSEIGNLSNLQVLLLSHNQLASLPPQIGNLSALRHLNISHNHFASLPRSLCTHFAFIYTTHKDFHANSLQSQFVWPFDALAYGADSYFSRLPSDIRRLLNLWVGAEQIPLPV